MRPSRTKRVLGAAIWLSGEALWDTCATCRVEPGATASNTDQQHYGRGHVLAGMTVFHVPNQRWMPRVTHLISEPPEIHPRPCA